MELLISRPNRSMLTNSQSRSVFAGWHNFEAWNIRIDMWPQLLTSVPTWWTVEYEGNQLLRVMNPCILAYFISWIQAPRENDDAMNTIWKISVQDVTFFEVAAFMDANEFGVERHKNYDPRVSVERRESRGILFAIHARIGACFSAEMFCHLLHTRGVKGECEMHA